MPLILSPERLVRQRPLLWRGVVATLWERQKIKRRERVTPLDLAVNGYSLAAITLEEIAVVNLYYLEEPQPDAQQRPQQRTPR